LVNQYNPGEIKTIYATPDKQIDTTTADIRTQNSSLRLYLEDKIVWRKWRISGGINIANIFNASKNTHVIEPRFRLNYTFDKTLSFEGSVGKTNQYYNVFNSSVLGLPTDSFIPTDVNLTNPNSTILSLGANKKVGTKFNLQIELYHKSLKNLNVIKPGSSFLLSGSNWEDELLSGGKGNSYGIETFLTKHTGQLTGWLSFTWSKTNREFEEINEGKPFPFRYDRTIDAAIVLTYAISKSLSISLNWIYTTGVATTLPKGIYPSHLSGGLVGQTASSGIDNFFEIPIKTETNDIYSNIIYGDHNQDRFPNYHRLDLSAKKSWKLWGLQQSIQLSIYNAYGRLNTYYVTSGYGNEPLLAQNLQNRQGNLSSIHLFPFIPSFSYKINY